MFRAMATSLIAAILTAYVGAAEIVRLEPVNFSEVTIQSDFWSPRQETNRHVSIPHNLDTCEKPAGSTISATPARVTP